MLMLLHCSYLASGRLHNPRIRPNKIGGPPSNNDSREGMVNAKGYQRWYLDLGVLGLYALPVVR